MCTILCAVGDKHTYAINAIAQNQNHRGPDNYFVRADERVAIACQRLAILDVEGGQQPMTDETDHTWISHSGEIYNFLELKKELMEIGYVRTKRGEVIASFG